MGPLIIAQYMASAAFLAVGSLHLFIWLRQRDDLANVLFVLTVTGAAANALAEPFFYRADTVESFNRAFRWANTFNALWVVAIVWFVAIRMDRWPARRTVILLLSVVFGLASAVNLFLPYGFLYAEITGLRSVVLPWGEQISLAEGSPTSWRVLTDLGFIGVTAFVAESAVNQYRKGHRADAMYLGGSLLIFLVLMLVAGLVVDLALLPIPYLFTWGYLAVALAMSSYMAGEVVRASALSAEVKQNEQRWRSLLEQVELLVSGVDGEGRFEYVNPFLTQVTGYTPDDLMGQSFPMLLPPQLREDSQRIFDAAVQAGELAPNEGPVLTKDGRTLQVSWSSVVLRNAGGEVTGMLSVGADITARLEAEESRDAALTETRKALEEVEKLRGQLEEEVIYLQDEISTAGHFSEILGDSDALKYVFQKVEQIAALDTTVLLEGETGVGKELFARAIHANSGRKSRPLIKVNCAALPASLVEAELFGHERGAFTGATKQRKGRFELAHQGTLFLDEVGELPLEMQGKLLRALAEGEFERIGAERTIQVDVRVIAATNRDLRAEVKDGRFREDLFYRLDVFPITVPALRDRKEDIPTLVRTFVQGFMRTAGKVIDEIPQAVMDELTQYNWPGNVRELENVIERAVVTTSGRQLRLVSRLANTAFAADSSVPYQGTLDEVERDYIERVLGLSNWRIEGNAGAAELLGLHPNTLRFRMRKLGITRPAK